MAEPAAAGTRHFPHTVVRAQIESVLRAWGMPAEAAEVTADVMVDTDLRGVDTHGISMLPVYGQWRAEGRLSFGARPVAVVHETPVALLVDGGGTLGHFPGVTAMRGAMQKARAMGMGLGSVRHSCHFGAAGYYTRMAAAEGLVGFAMTNTPGPQMAPTFGAQAKLGTNPIAFAAPAERNADFSLDMATTTVARGKIRNAMVEGKPIPLGWVADSHGTPTTDPGVHDTGGQQTPLGGLAALSSYKGYGLAVMVEILCACLSGASLVTSEGHANRIPGDMDLGQFFLAIDPEKFREPGGFESTLDDLIDDLRATRPIDPAQPVLVAGDPENRIAAERMAGGIPIPPGLYARVEETVADAGAEFLLAGEAL
jgi:LDH2 family malate/lactate/ureidoglycolate dehydrogenase